MKSSFSRISVIGLGYVGLPTAAMFASRKIEVVGVDVNQRTVDTVNRGEIHIVEPDLDILVRTAVRSGYLRATAIVEPAEAFVIAVPTPFQGDNHDPDLSYIEAASKAIAPALRPGNLVILESTVPVGTTEAMAAWLAEARPDLTFPQTHADASDIRIAYCPERMLPGNVMHELISNDRVIGGITPRCSGLAVKLYQAFTTGDCVVATSPRVAELTKLSENSFRDVNIAFANELSMICDELEIDVWELIRLTNRHPRVNILKPGPGVGGHCIAVDPWFIVSAASETARLIRTAREINDGKPGWVMDKVRSAIGAHLMDHPGKSAAEVTLAIYGLAFKPDIDDLRESPALRIARLIVAEHPGRISIVEPYLSSLEHIIERKNVELNNHELMPDVAIVLVGHSSFQEALRPPAGALDFCGILATTNRVLQPLPI